MSLVKNETVCKDAPVILDRNPTEYKGNLSALVEQTVTDRNTPVQSFHIDNNYITLWLSRPDNFKGCFPFISCEFLTLHKIISTCLGLETESFQPCIPIVVASFPQFFRTSHHSFFDNLVYTQFQVFPAC